MDEGLVGLLLPGLGLFSSLLELLEIVSFGCVDCWDAFNCMEDVVFSFDVCGRSLVRK